MNRPEGLKALVDYPGYYSTKTGQVWHEPTARHPNGKWLKSNKYARVRLYINGKYESDYTYNLTWQVLYGIIE